MFFSHGFPHSIYRKNDFITYQNSYFLIQNLALVADVVIFVKSDPWVNFMGKKISMEPIIYHKKIQTVFQGKKKQL